MLKLFKISVSFLKFLLRLKRWIVSRVKGKIHGRKMEFQMQVWVALLSCIPWARKHEKTFSTVLFLDFFFCQRQLCSFLLLRRRVYGRSWTIISICSVTLHRVKSKWLSSLKSARKLRSEIQNRWCFDFLTKRFENVHKYLSKEMENFMHFTFTQRKSHNSDKLA